MISAGAVREAEHVADQARQHQAHEEREAQQHRHAGRRVLGLLDREDEAEGAGHEDDEAHADAHRRHEAGRDADPGAEHRRHHRQREQPVGVAQHAVALLHAGGGVTEVDCLQAFVHGSSEGKDDE